MHLPPLPPPRQKPEAPGEPSTEQQLIARAVSQLNAGKIREAAKLLKGPLHSNDLYIQSAAQFFAGHCLLRVNRIDPAIRMWMDIDKPSRVRLQTAHYYYAARIAALKLFVDGKARWPDPPQPRIVGNMVYPPRGNWRSLPSMLRDILNDTALDAKQAEAALLLGDLAAREHDQNRAEAFYQKGLDWLNKFNLPHGYPELLADKDRLLHELSTKANAMARRSFDPATRYGNKLWRNAQSSAQEGEFEAASRSLRRFVQSAALADDPRIEHARYLLGKYLLAAGHRPAAFAAWDIAIQADPAGPYRAQMLLDMADQMLWKEFDAPEALKQLDRLASTIQTLANQTPATTQPTNTPTSTSPATPLFLTPEQYRKLSPTWQAAYRSLLQRSSLLVYIADRPDDAAGLLRRYADLPVTHSANLIDPYDWSSQTAKQVADALDAGLVGAHNLKLPSVGPDVRVVVALRLAEACFSANQWEMAKNFFDQVARPDTSLKRTDEQETYALLRAGNCCYHLFKPDLADQYAARVLALSGHIDTPAVRVATLRQAVVEYSIRKRPDSALRMMRQVQTRFPDSPQGQDAMFYEGVILEWTGRRKQAIAAYKVALARYSDSPGMRTAIRNRFKELGLPPPSIANYR